LADALTPTLAAVGPADVAPEPAAADSARLAPALLATDITNSDPAKRKPVLSLKPHKATP
jgi:hypothetical protein